MTATATLTEELVHRLAPDDNSMQAGRDLVRKKSFIKPGISPDGTWLLAQCKGSGSKPYEVSVDLAVESAPVGRCSCPSRKLPCKHVLGLLLSYIGAPDTFTEQEPPEELVGKREKQQQRAEKKKANEQVPRKVNQAALAKKTAAQREGLDLLEKLITDLVSAGQWFDAARLERLERQSKQMADAYLPGAMMRLQGLLALGRREDLTEEERIARGSDLIGQLWATVQKGRNYLDDKLAGDESQAEADAVIEEMLGKTWQMAELREKGYWRQNLSLLELAYERVDDDARRERVETSILLDLQEKKVLQAITYRPYGRFKFIPAQRSYTYPLTIVEAAIYPGFLNPRVRWDAAVEKTQPLEARHLQAAHAAAAPMLDSALTAFRQQIKNPLAPRDALVLVLCEKIGRVGDRVVVEDAKGARLEAVDRLPGDIRTQLGVEEELPAKISNVANLVRAAGELRKKPALLARLFARLANNTIVAEPLALLSPEKHLRLGL